MKKLIIATVTVLTTMGISAYTKDNSQPKNVLNVTQNKAESIDFSVKQTQNALISNEIGRANLAQAD